MSHDARCAIVLLVAAAGLASVVGCGGTSQDDMLRHAIRRPRDDDDNETKPAPPSPQPGDRGRADEKRGDAPTVEQQPAGGEPAEGRVEAGDGPARGQMAARDVSDGDAKEAGDPASAAPLAPPEVARTPLEARARTLENMRRIAEGFQAYLEKHNRLPAPASYDAGEAPLLSWRVHLLPYLEDERLAALHKEFHLDEPWDSRHNVKLLSRIPEVYASPERADEKTNYQVPFGTSTAFQGRRGITPRKVEDGLSQTLVLIEVDDARAVPWTSPGDFRLPPGSAHQGLGTLREDGIFVVVGDGRVRRLPANVGTAALRAMLTIDGSEKISLNRLTLPATTEPERPEDKLALETPPDTRLGESSGAAEESQPERPTIPDFAERARRALETGHDREALQLWQAALLIAADRDIRLRWVAGLRRPVAHVRWGLGVDYTGPATGRQKSGAAAADAYRRLTGELGAEVLLAVAERVDEGRGGVLFKATDDERGPRRTRPRAADNGGPPPLHAGVTWLGEGTRNVLQRVARREGVDLLGLFEVKVAPTRRNTYSHSVRLRLFDVAGGRELLVTPAVNNLRTELARSDRLAADPIHVARAAFTEYVDGQLRMERLPSAIKSEHAARRAAALAAGEYEDPLPALCELRFYHARRLIDAVQLLAAFRQLLGYEAGEKLAAGTDAEKAAALAPWLPDPRIGAATRKVARSAR